MTDTAQWDGLKIIHLQIKTRADDRHIVALCNKYLTKHRGMVNLVVIRLCGGCECRGDGVVPHTLLAVRLLVETEKR